MYANKMELTLYQRFIFPLLKRIIDLLASIILIFLLFPLFLLISLTVFLETRKFPIFVQRRALSLNSRLFNIYKFRTFKEDNISSEIDEGILSKPHLEDKVSSFGKFLRKTGLDELPQLINILKGDMSLVGPRPLSIEDLKMIARRYPEYHLRRSLIKSKPGLTGVWQTSKDENMEVDYMVFLDEFYDKEKCFTLDFYILVNTFRVLLFARHRDGIIRNEIEPERLKNFALYTGVSLILIFVLILTIINLI